MNANFVTEKMPQNNKVHETQPILHPSNPDEGAARYLAYVSRLARLSRYLAYTSDVGEAFRPVAHPRLVTASYLVSFGYVGYEIASKTQESVARKDTAEMTKRIFVETTCFQSLASLILPAFTIHSVVSASKKAFPKSRFLPSVIGLSTLPLLPILFDKPVEHLIEAAFDKFWKAEKTKTE
jgi:mitochondrial fission process protein 1